jgi:hypothetical protein
VPRLSQAVRPPIVEPKPSPRNDYYRACKHVNKQERMLEKRESTETNWRKPVFVKAEVQLGYASSVSHRTAEF